MLSYLDFHCLSITIFCQVASPLWHEQMYLWWWGGLRRLQASKPVMGRIGTLKISRCPWLGYLAGSEMLKSFWTCRSFGLILKILVSPNNKICSRNIKSLSVRMKFCQSNPWVWHCSTSLSSWSKFGFWSTISCHYVGKILLIVTWNHKK